LNDKNNGRRLSKMSTAAFFILSVPENIPSLSALKKQKKQKSVQSKMFARSPFDQ